MAQSTLFKVISSRSVNLLTLFLGRISSPSGCQVLVHILSTVPDNRPFLISKRGWDSNATPGFAVRRATQLAFFINLQRTVIGPAIDLRGRVNK